MRRVVCQKCIWPLFFNKHNKNRCAVKILWKCRFVKRKMDFLWTNWLLMSQILWWFDSCGYSTAATYIRRAKYGMFGYIRRWLKWGLISPRASSMVERVMRELGRRLKKTAYGWSDKGATKIARIILKRFTNANAWEDYWQNKMNCVGNVVINIGNYKCFSQKLGQ